MRGLGLSIFWYDAVNVTVISNANGASVTAAYRAFPDLMMMVVATHKATVAKSWFEIPNSGHNELMPPSGSRTPCQRKYPHMPTMSALVLKILLYDPRSAIGLMKLPNPSCSMNRP